MSDEQDSIVYHEVKQPERSFLAWLAVAGGLLLFVMLVARRRAS